ncbi:uncharacterized protein BDZ99DRAFT_575222 [Mytilinidion resinicola]|uniref:Nuclear membrane fusion protein Kar5 n=1 Tax=Mytilinidion resinicola TaxID=574789 RepID=A0A6A6Y7A3_9PEZI|nr:uncharacterized protein BDZ99DRAFT_575222 [Mytilinidion resinicola]KAF2804570.1 hypothetical protein BDZ99DRAFT_575222 [Mytilinidion resinicola]
MWAYTQSFMVTLLAALLIGATTGHQSVMGIEAVPSDLASKLQNPPIQRQELLSQALRIIHSVESSPSCNRLAALSLINSCQSLETSSKGTNTAEVNTELGLDEVKSEYAARLAVCELIGAGANVPRECAIFVPSSKACVKFRFSSFWGRDDHSETEDTLCYPEATRSQFGQCLKALEARPQYWTSYSNARQNAVVMCQASRDTVEKDEKIALYKSLADVTANIATALAESLQEAKKRLEEQLAYAEKVKATGTEALEEIRKGRESSLSALDSVTQTAQSVINMVTQAFMRAGNQAEDLDQSIQKSKEDILDMLKEVGVVHVENTALQTQQWQVSQEGALALQQTLEGLYNGLMISSELMTNMSERQILLDERLNMTFDILMSAVDEITEKIQRIRIFGGLGVSNTKLGATLVIVGAWFVSRRMAGFLSILYGIFLIIYSAGASPWFHYAFDKASSLVQHASVLLTTITIPPFIKFAALAVLAISSAMGLVYYISSFVSPNEDEVGEQGFMIKVEDPVLPTANPRQGRRHLNISALRY